MNHRAALIAGAPCGATAWAAVLLSSLGLPTYHNRRAHPHHRALRPREARTHAEASGYAIPDIRAAAASTLVVHLVRHPLASATTALETGAIPWTSACPPRGQSREHAAAAEVYRYASARDPAWSADAGTRALQCWERYHDAIERAIRRHHRDHTVLLAEHPCPGVIARVLRHAGIDRTNAEVQHAIRYTQGINHQTHRADGQPRREHPEPPTESDLTPDIRARLQRYRYPTDRSAHATAATA